MKISNSDMLNIIKLWHCALDDIPDKNILRGLLIAIRRPMNFLISSGEFRDLCLLKEGCYSLDEEARKEWVEVMKKLNYRRSPVFSNGATGGAVKMLGGWIHICKKIHVSSSLKNDHFFEKDFIDYYQTLKRSGKNDPVMLLGETKRKLFIGFKSDRDGIKALSNIRNESKNLELPE